MLSKLITVGDVFAVDTRRYKSRSDNPIQYAKQARVLAVKVPRAIHNSYYRPTTKNDGIRVVFLLDGLEKIVQSRDILEPWTDATVARQAAIEDARAKRADELQAMKDRKDRLRLAFRDIGIDVSFGWNITDSTVHMTIEDAEGMLDTHPARADH